MIRLQVIDDLAARIARLRLPRPAASSQSMGGGGQDHAGE